MVHLFATTTVVGPGVLYIFMLLALTVGHCLARQPLPQAFADQYGAKCLNGQPPEFDVYLNATSTAWVLFLEGGGWCYGTTANETLKSCAGRAGGIWPPPTLSAANGEILGSSTPAGLLTSAFASPAPVPVPLPPYNSPPSGADIGGVMSNDPVLNPDFYTWNKIFIHYCDGGSFGSSRIDPIPIATRAGEPTEMWMRGRNNFDAVIAYFRQNSTLGMGRATEVILSGGSAGGLAVFYNLDHLAELLGPSVRLTGFPDAGFFLDATTQANASAHLYRDEFRAADPIWNVTGSGGTNKACLADNVGGQEWKCLMAPYIAPYIKTPIYVANSGYDAWQMHNVLQTACIPTPAQSCTANENKSLRQFHNQFIANVTAGIMKGPRKAQNGAYISTCYVHEQNVNYCSGQNAIPNCVGWSPKEPGSIKWGYATKVTTSDGRNLTMQQAFGAYYKGDRGAAFAIDKNTFFDNPTCVFQGHPVNPLPPPPPPSPPPSTVCANYNGTWVDNSSAGFQPVSFVQNECAGSFGRSGQPSLGTFTVSVTTGLMSTSKSFHGGLTGKIEAGVGLSDALVWSNKVVWTRNCTSFAGAWSFEKDAQPSVTFVQTGCSGHFEGCQRYRTHGKRIRCSDAEFYGGLGGTLVLSQTDSEHTIEWDNGAVWYRQ